MKIAVIMSTYNSPVSLRKSMLGYVAQEDRDFELLIADDGSDGCTAEILKQSCFSSLNLKHVWHSDEGYRLSAIRNLAITNTDADYLIFTDGDVIPRKDFIASHRRHARPSAFTSGCRIDIPESWHRKFTDNQILENEIFSPEYMEKAGISIPLFRRWSLKSGGYGVGIMNLLQWRHCVFYGSNTGVWRDDLIRVNGFDEAWTGYGSEDRDIGFRLRNLGVKFRHLKHSFVQFHLAHPRPYQCVEEVRHNRSVMRSRQRSSIGWIPTGIIKQNVAPIHV